MDETQKLEAALKLVKAIAVRADRLSKQQSREIAELKQKVSKLERAASVGCLHGYRRST